MQNNNSNNGGKRFKSDPVSDQEILDAWENNQLDRFSVDQLKAFRRKYPDVKSANKKADLIENISEFIRTHRK